MYEVEKKLNDTCNPVSELGITSLDMPQANILNPLCPMPYRSRLLELSTLHHWPGVSCSLLSLGLHQPLLSLQLKMKNSAVEPTEMSRVMGFHDPNSGPGHEWVSTVNGQEQAQHWLLLVQKHGHSGESALKCPLVHYGVR